MKPGAWELVPNRSSCSSQSDPPRAGPPGMGPTKQNLSLTHRPQGQPSSLAQAGRTGGQAGHAVSFVQAGPKC